MFGGGKSKVVCPQCRAKNKPGARRCRVCTAIIDPEIDEGDRGFMGPGGRAEPAAAAPEPAATPDDGSFGISFEAGAPGGDAEPAAPADVDPFDAIVIDAPLRNPDTAPPPPLSDETFDPNWLDEQRD